MLETYQIFSFLGELTMPLEINGQVYYRTLEVCRKTGISRATLFRWLKGGVLEKIHRDRRGWKLFTDDDVSKIQREARQIKVEKNL